jgi:alkanesulfonate monooxygenase SsuD/methylene tetrahydromethanopterin reductase-like flavin-dependent oxidoreductase (luciferase family)
VPYAGAGATGLGKPLKLMARPFRADIPIYLAAFKPRAVELAAEIADGWLPIFFSPERARETFPAPFGRDSGFDIAPAVPALVAEDVETARDALRGYYALYVGGMGARGANFYNDLAVSYGYEKEAKEIQDLYLDGKQRDAAAAVPAGLIDEMALVGPPEHIKDRLSAWRDSGATTLLISTRDRATLRAVAEAVS